MSFEDIFRRRPVKILDRGEEKTVVPPTVQERYEIAQSARLLAQAFANPLGTERDRLFREAAAATPLPWILAEDGTPWILAREEEPAP